MPRKVWDRNQSWGVWELYLIGICTPSRYPFILVILSVGEKPHECDVCGARYLRKMSLITHQRIHTGIRFL